jgi:hypothetical protein
MVFTFAGSLHSKYMNYLLEMIADLELEFNPFLRDTNLMSMVIIRTVVTATSRPVISTRNFSTSASIPSSSEKTLITARIAFVTFGHAI